MRYVIGIDPDVDKCGFAVWAGRGFIDVKPLPVPQLIEAILSIRSSLEAEDSLIVHLEAGYLNKKSNYHDAFRQRCGARVAEKVAGDVGRNHGVGIVLRQFMEHYGIDHRLVKPSKTLGDSKAKAKLVLKAGGFRVDDESCSAAVLAMSVIP